MPVHLFHNLGAGRGSIFPLAPGAGSTSQIQVLRGSLFVEGITSDRAVTLIGVHSAIGSFFRRFFVKPRFAGHDVSQRTCAQEFYLQLKRLLVITRGSKLTSLEHFWEFTSMEN